MLAQSLIDPFASVDAKPEISLTSFFFDDADENKEAML